MVFNYGRIVRAHLGAQTESNAVQGLTKEVEKRLNFYSRHLQLFYVGKVNPPYERKPLFPGGICFHLQSISSNFPEAQNKFLNIAEDFKKSRTLIIDEYLPFLTDHYEVFLNYLRSSSSQEEARREYVLAINNGKLGRDLFDLSGEVTETINSGLHNLLSLRDTNQVTPSSSIKQLTDLVTLTNDLIKKLKSQRNVLGDIVVNLRSI